MLSYLVAGATIGPAVSQSLLDLTITLIFAYWIVYSIRNKSLKTIEWRKPYLFEYGFLFYVLAIAVGFIILGIGDAQAWLRLLKFTWIANFYLFIWVFSKYEINFTKLAKFFGFAYLIPNIYGIACTFYGYDPIRNKFYDPIHKVYGQFRLLGLLDSATYHAHANGLLLIFFLIILFFQFKKLSTFYKWLCGFAIVLMASGIFLTFTRGIWLSLTITTLIFLFFHNKKIFIAAILAGVICISGLYTFSESFRGRISHSMNTGNADQERWGLFNVHVEMFKESPLVGIGYANPLTHTPPEVWMKYGYQKIYINSHAHNQILNVMTTTGLLGVIPFLLFYLWFLVTNIRLVKKFKLENNQNFYILSIACLMTQIEFLLANITDIGFEYSKIRSLILLVWALVFCMWQNRLKIATNQVLPKAS